MIAWLIALPVLAVAAAGRSLSRRREGRVSVRGLLGGNMLLLGSALAMLVTAFGGPAQSTSSLRRRAGRLPTARP